MSQQQVTFLSALLHLEKRYRDAKTSQELAYRLANETLNLVQYDQAVVWHTSPTGKIVIDAVSGVDRVPATTPFTQTATLAIKGLELKNRTSPGSKHTPAELGEAAGAAAQELSWNTMLLIPTVENGKTVVAGMTVTRETLEWTDQELSLFARLGETAAHAWVALSPRRTRATSSAPLYRRFLKWIFPALFIGLMCLPIRLSVLAPAEVVATRTVMVTAPMDGIVESFHIRPDQAVTKNARLLSLDRTSLANRHTVARKALDVVRAEFERAQQRSFADRESREQLHLLKARMEQKAAEAEYVEALLARTTLTSPADGIAIFTDENEWLGRPVATGEKILTIAEPEHVQLKIMLPVQDAISLDSSEKAMFFLNVAPADPIRASVTDIGYKAVPTPDGGMGFPLRADLLDATPAPRIGLRGTVKLYGKKTTLFYAIMRKPLTRLRHFLGV
ncbi:MAG TPA: HlyD family efflux transporter periplasmic adaptor subunit [Desulfomicrobiaceae bacterium]|nr:HlyD family efflux transporter periplasmic adaptor subunit [Desulfomicrobiaceae bacterium]